MNFIANFLVVTSVFLDLSNSADLSSILQWNQSAGQLPFSAMAQQFP
jgi:hypothetical protein